MSDPLFSRFGREFRVGDVLFHEGELGEEMYVIQSGAVEITKAMGGVERPIATLGRGEFLGEMAILNGKPRTATADLRCVETVTASESLPTDHTQVGGDCPLGVRVASKAYQLRMAPVSPGRPPQDGLRQE